MLLVRHQYDDQHIKKAPTHANRLEVNIPSGDLKEINEKSRKEA